jgi:hypothetical protein
MGTALRILLAAVTAAAEDLEIGGTVCAAFILGNLVVNREIPGGMTRDQKPWAPVTIIRFVFGDYLRRCTAPL